MNQSDILSEFWKEHGRFVCIEPKYTGEEKGSHAKLVVRRRFACTQWIDAYRHRGRRGLQLPPLLLFCSRRPAFEGGSILLIDIDRSNRRWPSISGELHRPVLTVPRIHDMFLLHTTTAAPCQGKHLHTSIRRILILGFCIRLFISSDELPAEAQLQQVNFHHNIIRFQAFGNITGEIEFNISLYILFKSRILCSFFIH